jgi:hypothetical protein
MEVPSIEHSSTAGRPTHVKSFVIYELNIMTKPLSKCIKKQHSYTVTRFSLINMVFHYTKISIKFVYPFNLARETNASPSLLEFTSNSTPNTNKPGLHDILY